MDAVQPIMCECGCECGEAATTSDGGVSLCAECAEYVMDPTSGEVVCSRDPHVERVTECCGAGGQTRSYWRLRPLVAPPPDGEWACYWHSGGGRSRVMSHHATAAAASAAVVARGGPALGDYTSYPCGYEVRRWNGTGWSVPCYRY